MSFSDNYSTEVHDGRSGMPEWKAAGNPTVEIKATPTSTIESQTDWPAKPFGAQEAGYQALIQRLSGEGVAPRSRGDIQQQLELLGAPPPAAKETAILLWARIHQAPVKSAEATQSVEREPEVEKPRFVAGAETINSDTHPNHNEDSHFSNADNGEFLVADGIGGAKGGAEASQAVAAEVQQAFDELRTKTGNPTVDQAKAAIGKGILAAHNKWAEKVQADGSFKGSGTTVSVVKIVENEAIIGNMGDSRVYVLRANGELEQLTSDDSFGLLVAEQAKGLDYRRQLERKFSEADDESALDSEEAGYFGQRNIIMQAVGAGAGKPKIFSAPIAPGDRLVLTSDGIHDNLKDSQIRQIILESSSPEEAAKRLAAEAQIVSRDKTNSRHKPDDHTVVVAEIGQLVSPESKKSPVEAKPAEVASILESYASSNEAFYDMPQEAQTDVSVTANYPEVAEFWATLPDAERIVLYATIARKKMPIAQAQQGRELIKKYSAAMREAGKALYEGQKQRGEAMATNQFATYNSVEKAALAHHQQDNQARIKAEDLDKVRLGLQQLPADDQPVARRGAQNFGKLPAGEQALLNARLAALGNSAEKK